MGDYFKPWRRKIGVLTLVMALAFAVGWVRSLRLRDARSFVVGESLEVRLMSKEACLSLQTFDVEPPTLKLVTSPHKETFMYTFPNENERLEHEIFYDALDYRWALQHIGFRFGGFEMTEPEGQIRGFVWIIPY
jgi:hypothetical protein